METYNHNGLKASLFKDTRDLYIRHGYCIYKQGGDYIVTYFNGFQRFKYLYEVKDFLKNNHKNN